MWYGKATQKDLKLLSSVIKSAESIIGINLPSLYETYCKRLTKKTNVILKDNSHPANNYFDLMPSGRRFRHFKGNKRFLNSTYPQAVKFLNSKL